MRKSQMISTRLHAGVLPVLAAVTAVGLLGASGASASHGEGGDPYVFTNWDEADQLWSNPGNWNQPEPPGEGHIVWVNFTPEAAIVDYSAGATGELVIGQGGGDGAVYMTTGGAITVPHINMAWGSDRNGTWTQDGGATTVTGDLRAGREAGGGTAIVDISGGTFTSSNMYLGDQNVATNMTITGGTVTTGEIRLSDVSADSTATSSLAVTGGSLSALQIGIGARSGGTGAGELIIGGDAVVNTTNHIFLRPNGTFTVDGSDATISLNRSGGTGFEVVNDSVVNFTFDEGGISTVNIPNSTMRFSGPDGILNVDATAFEGTGTFDLFTFGAGYFDTGFTTFGEENLAFANGLSGHVEYNPNSIQLVVVPEPAALSLLGLGGLGLLRRRRA